MDSSDFFGISSIAYVLAMVLYISYLAFKNNTIGILATTFTIAGFASHTIAFIIRWKEFYDLGKMGILRAVPLTNLYESLVFFVWCIILGYLIIEWKYKTRTFGAFITPISAMALAFIDISGMSKEIHPLVPALQSNWLLAHVTLSFIAYAGFSVSFATAIMYLALSIDDKKSPYYILWTVMLGLFSIVLLAMGIDYLTFKIAGLSQKVFLKNYLFKATFRNESFLISITSYALSVCIILFIWNYGIYLKKLISSFKITQNQLDELTYKSIAVGFPVFTLGGLIFGAVWADQAWGRYWSWDPKETWSLITWFVYAFYIHARLLRGWRGAKIAIVSIVGFVSTIFTYLGVNLLLSGLHSYGSM
ncbi:MAG TPA: c-type cytochrome biogenesis protein CcsB [Nitrospirae bacterium]|nr:c-type cytochrome biogenesis protein CcsB [Nitrospirota bacterium]